MKTYKTLAKGDIILSENGRLRQSFIVTCVTPQRIDLAYVEVSADDGTGTGNYVPTRVCVDTRDIDLVLFLLPTGFVRSEHGDSGCCLTWPIDTPIEMIIKIHGYNE